MQADLIIVGAGMVGSALALALEHSGLEILVVDGGPLSVRPFAAEGAFEPRVSALSAASQRILERLGAWEGILARRASPYAEMQVWDGSGTGQIHFSAASVHAEVLGHIVENRVVQDALLDRLHDCDLGLLANARLEQMRRSGDDWLLTLADGRQLDQQALLLVAKMCFQRVWELFAQCLGRLLDRLRRARINSEARQSGQLEGQVMFAGVLNQGGVAFHGSPLRALLRTSVTIVAMKTSSTSPLVSAAYCRSAKWSASPPRTRAARVR